MRTVPLSRCLAAVFVILLVVSGCSNHGAGPLAPTLHEGRSQIHAPYTIPPGYYDGVDTSSPSALRATLHDAIKDHIRYPYTSTATDTWDILELADEDPNDPGRILDIYRNASYPKQGGGNTYYNREHSWPNSYGYPNDNSTNFPYTDCHALFLVDDSYNSARNNKPYRNCDAGCGEWPTDYNDGRGGGSGVYPGNSNWTSGAYTAGTWETWGGRRGDVARALFYLDVRYEGGVNGNTGTPEPDLILTDDEGLIAASNTGSNESVAYMGMLSVLLQWNHEDPVDSLERARDEVVYSFQGNRNPFVDHPEWVDCVFAGECGSVDTTPPAAPTGLAAVAGDGAVDLDWDDNTEGDLIGYNVYRSETGGAPFSRVNPALVTASSYHDGTVTNGVTYTYAVAAVDTSANESAMSATAQATPQGSGGSATAWINEFHYDNASTDTGEFIEVAGSAGTDLTGWQLLGYNGSDFGVYQTVNLSGTIPDQQGGYGTAAVAFTGLQNGSPDGIALVNGSGTVLEFLSYEGVITAVDGPAAGMTSTDVGVAESSSTPVGYSLQRTGSGTSGADFTWQSPMPATEGFPNTGQTLGTGGGDVTPPAAPTGLVATAGDAEVGLDWADNGEADLDGYNVYRSDQPGGPYAQLNANPIGASDYADTGVQNGTTYYYVVTAVDLTGNESGGSAEASATPQAPPPTEAFHVAAISLSSTPANRKLDYGRAVVTVVDASGNPVEGVQVTGGFSGDLNETVIATTGADGTAVLTTSGKAKAPIQFDFCVDGAAKAGWTYDSGANVVTCTSFGPA
jgi:endonuclease I/fibronectin type 3 domain-containing protein